MTGGLLSNFHLVRALAAFAHVRVLSLDPRAPSPGRARDLGYEARSCLPPPWPPGVAYVKWRPFLRRVANEMISAWGQPDIIVATTSVLPMLDAAGGARRVALVRAYENFGWKVPGGTLAERWQGLRLDAMSGFASRRLVRRADLVVTNSRFMSGLVAEVFDTSRVAVLYPCIDVEGDAGSEGASPASLRAQPRVGFVHRGAGKNLSFVERLARRVPEVEFHVFGPHLRDRSAPANLLFRGWEPRRDRMFRTAPLWIVPSRWREPFGRVAAEAQGFGCRVLVSNRGGLPEAAGQADSIVPSLDVDRWAEAVRSALDRPWTADERLRNSRRVTATFGIEAHDRQVRALFTASGAGA